MKNKKWKGLGAAAIFVLAFTLGAVAPERASAALGDVWAVGNDDARVTKDGDMVILRPMQVASDATSLSAVEEITTIINTAGYAVVESSGGVVTLTNTPTISTTTSAGLALATGATITLRGEDDANAVVIQDDDALSGSQVELGASTRSLGKNDILVLKWDAEASTTGRWLEISFSSLD